MIDCTITSGAISAAAALIGVGIGSVLTYKFGRIRDRLELRRDVLRRVMGYRWQLTLSDSQSKGEFFTALNEILIVFAGEKEVEKAHEKYQIKHNFDDLVYLVKVMAKSAKIPTEKIDRNWFESPFVGGVD